MRTPKTASERSAKYHKRLEEDALCNRCGALPPKYGVNPYGVPYKRCVACLTEDTLYQQKKRHAASLAS